MYKLILSILLVILTRQQSRTNLPNNEEIEHLIFLKDKIFYMTRSKEIFGFISSSTGEFMTQEVVKEREAVIRIDKHNNKVYLRQGSSQVLVFQLNTLDIRHLRFQIKFQHQRLVDLIATEEGVYALTNKDLRVYEGAPDYLPESSNNIVASCKRRQWFIKLFLSGTQKQAQANVFLLQDQEICLKKLSLSSKTSSQKCLFNVTSDVVEIHRIRQGYLVVTNDFNYVINEKEQVYTFKAQLSQVNSKIASVASEFKTFVFEEKVKVDGLEVVGSTEQFQFWLKKDANGSLKLTVNGKTFWTFQTKEIPQRSWISKIEGNTFALIVQFYKNILRRYELELTSGEVKQSWPSVEVLNEEEEL